MAVLCGMQGVGKTTAAAGFVYSGLSENVVWLDSHSREYLQMELENYLENIGACTGKEDVWEAAVHIFKRLKNTLIVFDDANAVEIQKWIASLPKEGCSYLVTTYNESFAFANDKKIYVKTWDEQAGERFFLRLLPEEKRNQRAETVRELAEYCGGLPLALEQAALYFGSAPCTLEEFVKSLADNSITWEEAEKNADGLSYTGSGHPGIFATFRLTYRKICEYGEEKKEYALAGKILEYMAFLDAKSIRQELLCQLDSGLKEQALFHKAAAILASRRLVEYEQGYMIIRDVVQQVIRLCMPEEEKGCRLTDIIKCLRRELSDQQMAQWEFDRLSPILLHLSHIRRLPEYRLIETSGDMAYLCCEIAEFQYEIGNHRGCEASYMGVTVLPCEWIRLRAYIGLARLYELKSDYKKAEDYINKTEEDINLLLMLKKHCPQDYNGYLVVKAFIEQGYGHIPAALDWFEKAEDDLESGNFDEGQKIFNNMLVQNGMGNCYKELEQYEKAEQCFCRAVRIGEKIVEKREEGLPVLAQIRGNYALVLRDQGQYDRAAEYLTEEERIFQQWTENWEQKFQRSGKLRLPRSFLSDGQDKDSINYAINQYNLANLYMRWELPGHYGKALRYLKEGKSLLLQSGNKGHLLMLEIEIQTCRALYLDGQYENAVIQGRRALEETVTSRNDDAVVKERIALCQYVSDACISCGKYNDAADILKEARLLCIQINRVRSARKYFLVSMLCKIFSKVKKRRKNS